MGNNARQNRWNFYFGVGMVALGVLYLIGTIFNISVAGILWPFFIIVPGLAFFYFMVQGGKNAAALAIPGSIVTTTGLLLLYQSLTNHWESWAYAWALIVPTSLGVGIYITGIWSENESMRRAGQGFVRVGVIMLIVGGLFFEMIFSISGDRSNNITWPVLLIVAGIYLVAQELGVLSLGRTSGSKTAAESPVELEAPVADVSDETTTDENQEE